MIISRIESFSSVLINEYFQQKELGYHKVKHLIQYFGHSINGVYSEQDNITYSINRVIGVFRKFEINLFGRCNRSLLYS